MRLQIKPAIDLAGRFLDIPVLVIWVVPNFDQCSNLLPLFLPLQAGLRCTGSAANHGVAHLRNSQESRNVILNINNSKQSSPHEPNAEFEAQILQNTVNHAAHAMFAVEAPLLWRICQKVLLRFA